MSPKQWDPEKPDRLQATGWWAKRSASYGVWIFLGAVVLIFALAFAFWP